MPRARGWAGSIIGCYGITISGTVFDTIFTLTFTGLLVYGFSEKFFLNYTYFSEQFKREIGKTPIQYITEIRINHAKLLLREHRYTIEEIARSVGYQSGKTFSQAFTQIVGVSPKKYAKSAKEGKNP